MRWIHAPLLHFLLFGALLFFARAASESQADPGRRAEAAPLEVIEPDPAALAMEFRSQAGRAPSADELARLRSRRIDDELLYREALSRGLLDRDGGVQTRLIQKMLFLDGDARIEEAPALLARARDLELHKDDVVVRRILIQKMRLMASALAAEERPDEPLLRTRYGERRESLRGSDRISLSHVFLSHDAPHATDRDRAADLRSELMERDPAPGEAIAMGDAFPLGHRFSRISERELEGRMGRGFGAAAFAVGLGTWSEPIESAYGQHLVFVEAHHPGEVPPFEAVRATLRFEIERERQAEKLEDFLETLRRRARVVSAPGAEA